MIIEIDAMASVPPPYEAPFNARGVHGFEPRLAMTRMAEA